MAPRTITVADVRRDPAAANKAYLDGAPLRVPFTDALGVWRSFDSFDLSDGFKAELNLAGQQLSVAGGSASVSADRLEQVRRSVGDPGDSDDTPAAAPPDAGNVVVVVLGALAVAAVIVAVGFGVGFIYGVVTGGDDDGAVSVSNSDGGGATVTRDDNNQPALAVGLGRGGTS